MARVGWTLVRVAAWLTLLGGGLALLVVPESAPGWVLAALGTSVVVLARAWRASRGTALRAAVVWAVVAMAFGIISQTLAMWELPVEGRPWTGHGTYLACLATLAALTTVLNARRPGGGAWAFLMVLLVLVFLIPWLEGVGLVGSASALERLRLEVPWSLFFGLLILTGTTNYLPTRHGLAALAVAVGLGLELVGLVMTDWPRTSRAWIWTAVPWFLALALWTAEATAARPRAGGSGLERLWLWFRDRWGVVWALRVMERFNRAAGSAHWPIRLEWHGVESTEPLEPGELPEPIPEAAEATLRGLLRRFADEERLAEASRPAEP